MRKAWAEVWREAGPFIGAASVLMLVFDVGVAFGRLQG